MLDSRLVLVTVPLSLIGVNSAGSDHAAGPPLGSVYHVPVSRGSELYSATAADEGPDGGVWSLAGPRLGKDSLFFIFYFFRQSWILTFPSTAQSPQDEHVSFWILTFRQPHSHLRTNTLVLGF